MHRRFPRWLVLAVTCGAIGMSPVALAQNDRAAADAAATSTGTFAGTFFISRATHANGEQTIEILGSLLIWTLLTLSVFNLGLIGYLTLNNQKKNIVPAGVVDEVRRMLVAGNYRGALELTAREPSFFSRVLHSGLGQANHGFAAVIRALEQSADALITARMRPIEVLYMFGQISPMMGLLGTVYGIIFAFRVFVSMGGRASPALLAGGIGTALVATFWGLVVAIPALAGYSMLRNKVDQLTMQAVTAAEDMLTDLRPAPAKTSAVAPLPKPSVKPMPEVPR